jgi:hypothetical protein
MNIDKARHEKCITKSMDAMARVFIDYPLCGTGCLDDAMIEDHRAVIDRFHSILEREQF